MVGILIATAALTYLLVCAFVWFRQSSLIWFPGPPPETTPGAAGLWFDDWKLATPDGALLHAWRMRAENPRGAIVFCHGNAGNIASRIERAHVFVDGGFDVVLFDYRGYGSSTGEPTEEGTYVDAECVWTKLVDLGFAPGSVTAFGESLGGAVAIELAHRRRVGALVVEDTFTALADMAARVYPWLPVRLILRVRYASLSKMSELAVPVMVIHSRDDELVPFEQGRALFESAPEPKCFLETVGPHAGAGFTARFEWREAVTAFLASHASSR